VSVELPVEQHGVDVDELLGLRQQSIHDAGERVRGRVLGFPAGAFLYGFDPENDRDVIADEGDRRILEPVADLLPAALAVGLPVAFVVRRMYPRDLDLTRIPAAIPPGLAYFLVFAKELVLANVEVAYRVLSPSMPIDPEMLEIPLRVESDMGVTTIANSITMTPGTLTMDYDEERNALYVHAIYCEDPADLVDPIRSWEDYALQIFDEPATPDTPAPEPYVYDPDAGGADDGTATETTVDDGGAPDGG